MPTSKQKRKNDAEWCRHYGLQVGDRFYARQCYGVQESKWEHEYQITAIGERTVLSKEVKNHGKFRREKPHTLMLNSHILRPAICQNP